MNWDSSDGRRVLSARLVLIGLPSFVFCSVAHICMDGYMAHPPYGVFHYLSDLLWISCFVSAAIIGRKSNLILRQFLTILLPAFCISRLLLGSLGGILILLELPLCIIAGAISFRSLRRAGVNLSALPETERKQYQRAVRRRISSVFIALLAVILFCWLGWFIYQEIRAARAPRATVSESALPFTCRLPISDEPCIWLTLPNNKRLALWWEDSAYPSWGERLYHEPSRIWQDDRLGKSSDRVKSYIQMGLNTELSKESDPKVYSLFVDDYCIAWSLLTNRNSNVLISVRHAHPTELDYLKQRYGKWPL